MQDRLCGIFSAALDLLDRERREPDRWEEECLSYALGALACGLYPAAEVELAAFARLVAERPREEVALLASKPRRFSKEMLRHGLDHVISRSAVDDMPLAGHLAVHSFLGASL
jgi:hypothetical protein